MRRAYVLWLLGSIGCASGVGPPTAPTPGTPAVAAALGMRYTFAIDADLSNLTALVCFDGPAPPALICGERGAEDHLSSAELASPGPPRPLVFQHGRIPLDGVPADACLRYRATLGEEGDHYGGAVLTSVTEWLWRPPRATRVGNIEARFELPEGVDVSVPWSGQSGVYTLDRSAFGFKAYAVFGRFERERFDVPGARVEVAILDGLPPATRARVRPWLETAARVASLVTGRFPRDRAQIVVIPSRADDEPVGFGQMTRGGGASAVMFLHSNAQLEPLLRSWVAVHEFSHLLHPFVERQEAWLSEGIATYYQEVLRVRAGLQPEHEAWRRLYEGSMRGRAARQSLERESAEMYVSYQFPMVYWAGAAVALMTDVELRSGTPQSSLDRVLGDLSRCCSSTARAWSAPRVIARFDGLAGRPVLGPIVDRYVERRPLPSLGPLLARLGVVVEGDDIRFDDSAELAGVRRDIMRVDAAEAQRVRELLSGVR